MELLAFLCYLVMAVLTSLNSQGLHSPDRQKTAFSYFLRHRPDIILLQETHWTDDIEMQIQREWDGEIIFNHGTNTARGVAILLHSQLECSVKQKGSDNEGRILNIVLELESHTLNIINIYVPQTDSERRTFFSGLDNFISEDFDNIIGGDYNCIENPKLDKFGGNPNARNYAAQLLMECVRGIISLIFGGNETKISVALLGPPNTLRTIQSYVPGLINF